MLTVEATVVKSMESKMGNDDFIEYVIAGDDLEEVLKAVEKVSAKGDQK